MEYIPVGILIEAREIIDNKGKRPFRLTLLDLKNKNILQYFPDYIRDFSPAQFRYHLDIQNFNKNICLECDQPTKWRSRGRYSYFCGANCSNKNSEKKQKIIDISMSRHGVPVPSKSQQSIDKLIDTNYKTFGFKSSAMHPDIKEKAKKTCLGNFGFKSSAMHYNLENYNKLSKKFIEKNFITLEGYVKREKFAEFLECNDLKPFEFCRQFGVDYIRRPTGGGYDTKKPGTLYYILDLITNLYKIGITNGTLNDRFGKEMMKEIQVIKLWYFENGQCAFDQEQAYHKLFKDQRINNDRFKDVGGYTEFFESDVLQLNKKNKEEL